MSFGLVGPAGFLGRAGLLLVISGTLSLGACVGSTDDGVSDKPDGLGEPCSSEDTIGALCLAGFVCVEQSAGAGGVCEAEPGGCADIPSFCDCDLAGLCDGDPALCFDVDGRHGVVCE